VNDLPHKLVRVGSERCITGEKAALMTAIQEVHVRGATPAIDGIPTSLVSRGCRVHNDVTNRDLPIGWQRAGVSVPQLDQPGRNSGRGKQRNVSRKAVERSEREVIRVGVRDQNGIQLRKVSECDTRLADPGEEPPERVIEIGVRQYALCANFDEERGMADVCDAHGRYSCARSTPCVTDTPAVVSLAVLLLCC